MVRVESPRASRNTRLAVPTGERPSSGVHNERLLPGLPDEWLGWPIGVDVAFTRTPSNCVYAELFDEFRVRNLAEALETLFAKKNAYAFVHYRFHGEGFIPAYEWYVSWPLARMGKPTDEGRAIGGCLTFRWLARGLARREQCVGEAPWDRVPDDTIFEIWNEPTTVYGFKHTYMLRVGGRTPEAAIANWRACAKVIRAFRRYGKAGPAGP